MWLGLMTTHWQTWLFSSTSTYHSADLLTCFLTVLFASASEAAATWRFTNFVLYCIVWTWWCNDATALASYATTTMMMMMNKTEVSNFSLRQKVCSETTTTTI